MQSCADLKQPLSLRDVLTEAEFVGADDVPLAACTSDSRAVRPGAVFVAVRGMHSDGHDFVADAVARGCAAVVAQRPLTGVGVPVCYVPDTGAAYGRSAMPWPAIRRGT